MDGPNANLLNETRSDADVGKKSLVLGTCGLHVLHHAIKHCKNASTWDIKKPLSAMYKICYKSSSLWSDYEKLKSVSLTDYPLKICSYWWAENENVAKKPYIVWPKLKEDV